ncbi:transposase [Cucumis melo var. makuwa]|uniref:Transposase n=1 Tax=Cucumis melo var. makuwa TaxID=1194695 RepID=A0A5A7VJ22_CUCMM|nr:transposase [Cucumis melo var. makuwa]
MAPQKDFPYKCANDDLGDMLSHYPLVSKWNSTSDIDESGDKYTRLDCEGTWVTTRLSLDKASWRYEPYCYEANDVDTPKEKGESSTQKRKCGSTEMKEITRARSGGQKLVIQYNELGQAIGKNATKLKSFIGTTVLFHAGFVVDPRSKKTIIQNAGVCFRQFKYRLTTTYVLPFLDDVEKLKFPPNEYSFIDQQHWTDFVASRMKEDFKKKSENGKEKQKNYKYNHRTSRKGYANLMEELKASSSDQIDRSIVWKQARMDRKGQISDEETKEVVNLIDELVATQNTTNAFGEEDILTRALGGKDRLGILCGVGKYVTKKKYFHTTTQQKINGKEDEKATSKEHDRMAKRIKELEEELLKMKEKDDCVGDLKEEPGMGSKEKSSMEGAENVNDLEDLSNDLESEKDVEDVVELNEDIKVNIAKEDEEVEGVTLDKMKVGIPCKLVFETKDHVVTWGTIIDSDVEGDNVKVAVDVVVDGIVQFSFHQSKGCTKCPRKYLYTRMESSRTLNLYKFVGSISCGSPKEERAQLLTARLLGTDYDQLLLIPYNFGNHWTLVVVNLTKGAAFWIDPLKNRMDRDVTEVVERSFNIMNKKKPNWRVVKMKDSPRAYTQDDIDCIRSKWAEFVGKHVHCA